MTRQYPPSFARVAAVSIPVHLGDVRKNTDEIIAATDRMRKRGVDLAVFPELCLTGYTLGDLLQHSLVQKQALDALLTLARIATDIAIVVGLPVCHEGRLFNCAAVLSDGTVQGIVPKTYLPNGVEFYETRWFVSGTQAKGYIELPDPRRLADSSLTKANKGNRPRSGEYDESPECIVPFSPSLLFSIDDWHFAVEICEDLWTPIPPSSHYAVAGADIIVNPSASNALVAKHAYRRELLMQQSARLYAGYVYAGAGFGESTSDLVFCGYTGVFENGRALAEGKRFQMEGGEAIADIDIQRLRYQRQRNGSFFQDPQDTRVEMTPCPCGFGNALKALPLLRPIDPTPFVPAGAQAEDRLEEIVQIQCVGLITRLKAIGCKNVVIGVSGGLDSTLALLIAVRAFDALKLPRAGIHAFTLPGMGTGTRTKTNADLLMAALGVSAKEVSIEAAVRQHFADIGQDESVHDVTYENCQARERTQILMDYANKVSGIVLGTGDMSEAALGFCTYNGDHMSMYNVNCSVPKTLVKGLVRYLSERGFGDEVRAVCQDVLDTPISPELLPVNEGELNQRTEDILGDYALHDFFLYHLLDSGSDPERLKLLAAQAFGGVYDESKISTQLNTFLKRFFQQQYKRNCVPDGPKVGSISLSPRGDLRMPSDMSGAMWRDAAR